MSCFTHIRPATSRTTTSCWWPKPTSAFRFTVSDDGHGLRPRTDSPGMGLGLALIANSCDDLTLDTSEAAGTVVRITFLR